MSQSRQIKLKRPHTHAGRYYQAGDVIIVTAEQAEWLIGIGAAESAEAERPVKRGDR